MEDTYHESGKTGGRNPHSQPRWINRPLRLYAALVAVVLVYPEKSNAAAAATGAFAEAVKAHFLTKSGFQPNDLISRDDFDQVVKRLEKTDAPVARFAALREQIPSDDSFLQGLTRSKRGLGFLRKVSGIPGGFASVEDLASRPDGEKTLNQLTRDPGGEKMIRYMATTPGGKQLLRMTPGGRPARKPKPSRIYTAADLLKALQQADAAAQ